MTLFGADGAQYSITFVIAPVGREERAPDEKAGAKILVGRYVLYNQRTAYVKSVSQSSQIELVEMQSKKEKTLPFPSAAIRPIEQFGVSVFDLANEPALLSESSFEWVIDMEVSDKRVLNMIHKNIQFR